MLSEVEASNACRKAHSVKDATDPWPSAFLGRDSA